MPNYSVNELESLVQEGKFRKKVIKSTYTREFLSRFYDSVKTGILVGSVFGGGFGGVGLSFVGSKKLLSDEVFSYNDAGTMAMVGLLGFGFLGGVLGSMPTFYNWKERAKPYVDAGGKIIYEEKGLKFNRESFILPANHQIDPDTRVDWNLPFVISPADLSTALNP